RLLAGQLAGGALAQVETHVESCVRCQKTLEQLTQSADWQRSGGDAPSLEKSAAFLRPLMEGRPPPGFRSHSNGTRDRLAAHLTRATAEWTPPPVVAGYELLEELGRGVSGVVYKARQAASNRLVALKLLKPRSQQGFSVRFRREVQALAWLQHPHIVRIH